MNATAIRTTILQQMADIAAQQGRTLAHVTDEQPLLETGLDSLCLAILVANLEDHLGLDPFAREDVAFPVTVGDLIHLYETEPV